MTLEDDTSINVWESFGDFLTSSMVELFAARGIAIRHSTELDGRLDYAASIPFAGALVKGTTGLCMATPTLDRLMAKHDQAHMHGNQDWLREMANQLLGRFKRKLLENGVTITMGLPSILSGPRLRFVQEARAELSTYGFHSEAGPIVTWLEAKFAEGQEPVLVANPSVNTPSEGTLKYF
jgi:hypothetical protein